MNKKLLLLFILLTSAVKLRAQGTFTFASAVEGATITLNQGANINSRYAYGVTSVTPGFYAGFSLTGFGNTDKWKLQFGTADADFLTGTNQNAYLTKWVIEAFDGTTWYVIFYSDNSSSAFIPPISGWQDATGALDIMTFLNFTQSPTISISPSTLAAATVGVAYSQSVTASNGTSPYIYSVTSGALPGGLSLSSAGVLSGTPTAGGSFNFTITAKDASTTVGPYIGSQSYTLTVNAPTITLSPNPSSLPNPTAGTSYSQAITASGGSGSYTYTEVGALPTGISLSSGGVLSGTTNFSGSYPITITAKDGSPAPGPYTGSQTYTLLVNAPTITLSPGTLSNAIVGTAYSQTITASGGIGTYTYSATSGALPTGLTLNSSTGGLSGTPTTGGNSSFTIKATDSFGNTGSQSYSLMVNAPLTVTTDAGSSSFVAGDNVASTPVIVDAGISVTDGASTTLASATIGITGNFHAGEDILSFTNNGTTMGNIMGSYNYGTGVLTLTSAGATATLAQWQSALQAVTYTDVAITPNNATRTISFTVNDGTNTSNTATRTITVADTDQTPIVTTTGGTTNYVGGTSAVTIDGGISVSDPDNTTQASGIISIVSGFHSGDVLTFVNTSWSTYGNIVGSYNAATGVLTLTSSGATASTTQWSNALSAVKFSAGGSATPGNRTVSFSVNDGTKTSAVATDGVNVQAPPTITLSPTGLSPATVGTAYNQTITASGGTAPYTYSITSGVLPAGVTLGSSGALSGTPTASGTFTLTIDATDKSSYTGSQSYTLTVNAPTITLSPATLPEAPFQSSYNQNITASGGTSPYTYTVTSGSLPSGLTLVSSGQLTGLPNAGGVYNFTIKATDASGYTGLQAYTLAVPTISFTGSFSALNTVYGTPSSPTSISVSGANLSEGINAIQFDPSSPFEISSDGIFYGQSAFIGPPSVVPGTVTGTIYVRLKATVSANNSISGGFIVFSSSLNGPQFQVNIPTSVVTPKDITVSAAAETKTYGQVDPAISYTYSPALVAGDSFTGSLGRMAGENVGTYAINQGSLALNSNYNLTYNGANLTINPVAITVTANAQSKTYGGADPALTYNITSGSLVGSDAFTGSLSRTSGESVGIYAINQGSLALNSNYSLTYTGANLAIAPAAIAITAHAQTKTYGQADPALSYTFSPALVTGDSFTGSLSRAAGENVGTYAINQGTLALNSNYNLTYTGANLAIAPAAVTVTANAQSKTYGQTDPALSYTFSPALAAGDNFTGSLSRSAGESAGTYLINQGTLALSNNYTLKYTGADLTIGQAILTITADDQTKVYGATNPVLTAHYSGFINGDDASKFTTVPSLITTATTSSAAGNYIITASSAAIPNYTIAYQPGTLTVTKALLTITANNQSRNYGTTNPALTMSYSGFLNGDDASKLSAAPTASTTAGVNTGPGAYPITASGGASPNYIFAYVPGTLTIVPLRDDSLSNLTVNQGSVSLSPGFSSGVYNYSATVENQVDKINITPQFGPGATAQVNGNTLSNNSSSNDIPLQAGSNIITITVTAQDGSQHTYTMSVYRGVPPSSITATNILTPNGDGKNDTWLIKDINLYPDNIVSVYDRAGRLVYSKRGYQNDWDGTAVNGSPLSQGTYYFTVYLGNDKTTLKGFITIIRE